MLLWSLKIYKDLIYIFMIMMIQRWEVTTVNTGGSVNFLPPVQISPEINIFFCMISTEILSSLIYLCFFPKHCCNFIIKLIATQKNA